MKTIKHTIRRTSTTTVGGKTVTKRLRRTVTRRHVDDANVATAKAEIAATARRA